MASADQIAHDMTLRAKFRRGRDDQVHETCLRAASALRALDAGQRVDWRIVRNVCDALDRIHRRCPNDGTGLEAAASRAADRLRGLKWPPQERAAP